MPRDPRPESPGFQAGGRFNKVVEFPGCTIPGAEGVPPEIAEFLDDFMQRAATESIECVAVSAVTRNGEVITGYARISGARLFTLLGGVAYLKRRLVEVIEE
jgi:hypothetical protein